MLKKIDEVTKYERPPASWRSNRRRKSEGTLSPSIASREMRFASNKRVNVSIKIDCIIKVC